MAKMSLDSITSGVVDVPEKIVLYGPEGIGKSSWGADAPSPVFLAPDEGTNKLDVKRFPKPESWDDVTEAILSLGGGGHDYKTLVIDTLDAVEPLVWEHVCSRDRKRSIKDFDYGEGYISALFEWRKLAKMLDELRFGQNMEIICLAHSHIRQFQNPLGQNYDRYEMKLHRKSGDFLKEWADTVLFANYETYTKKDGSQAKGVGGDSRVVYTSHRAGWDAKNRSSLPAKLPLYYRDYDEARRSGIPADPAELRSAIAEKLELLKDEKVTAYVNDRVETATAADLAKINDRLNAKIAEQEDSNAEA